MTVFSSQAEKLESEKLKVAIQLSLTHMLAQPLGSSSPIRLSPTALLLSSSLLCVVLRLSVSATCSRARLRTGSASSTSWRTSSRRSSWRYSGVRSTMSR